MITYNFYSKLNKGTNLVPSKIYIMYDSIKGYINSNEIKDNNFYKRLPSLLSNVSKVIYENGRSLIKGNYKNIHFCISESKIIFSGSLTKFFNGNNYNQLTRQQTELSINKLEDLLLINLSDAHLSKIDISHNFIMEYPTSNYYYFLGTSDYFERFKQPNSIYYKNHKKVKLFYDKNLECENNNVIMPGFIKERNLLRYELRFINRINNQLNNDIRLNSLFNEDVYMNIIDIWIDEYNNINKNRLFMPCINDLTPKSAKDILLSALIEKIGMNEVIELTEQWNESFTNTKSKRRFNNDLNSLKGLTQESSLISELNKKVNKLKEYYR